MEFSDLTEGELEERLLHGVDIETMLASRGWKLVLEAMGRTIKAWDRELRNVNPDDKTRVMQLQISINMCDNIIPNIINGLRQAGRLAFEEKKFRGETSVL